MPTAAARDPGKQPTVRIDPAQGPHSAGLALVCDVSESPFGKEVAMRDRALLLLFTLVVLLALAAPLVAYADGGGPGPG